MNVKNRNILYGYRFENGSIVADESESEIVKLVFTEYAKGLSLLKIASILVLQISLHLYYMQKSKNCQYVLYTDNSVSY